MNILRACGWFSLSAGLVLGAASCDDGGDSSQITGLSRPDPSVEVASGQGCVPGQTSPCVGVCGSFGLGYQVCAADGRSYGECQCPPLLNLGGMNTETIGGATVIPPRFDTQPGGDPDAPLGVPGNPVVNSAIVGARCVRDSDCGGELSCLEGDSDSLGIGGPAGGYCTMPCDSDITCSGVDRASSCSEVAGRALCLRRCQSQDPTEGESKCLDRPDLTCLSSAALGDVEPTAEPQFGICAPGCQSDAACGGRSCDLSTGLCSSNPRPGDPVGSPCDEPATCAAGICLGATEEASGVCSSFCTVGVPGCGYDGSEAVVGAACLLPQVQSEGQGDRGLCFELCEADADCIGDGFVCVPEPTSALGGVCLPPPADTGEPEGPDVPPSTSDGANLGASCEDDVDCGDDLICLRAEDDPFGLDGGPPGGYCSYPCELAEDCPGDGGVCASTPGGGYCLAFCEIQTPGECGGRTDVECAPLGFSGACLPLCTSDDQCGDLVCDLVNGLCIDPVSVDPGEEPTPACTSDADCAEGICDLATGECGAAPEPACTTDADCPDGICDLATGECVLVPESCTSDAECGADVCDLATGACVAAPVCALDDECGDGEVCSPLDLQCIAAPPTPIGAACSLDTECTGASPSEDDTRLCLAVAESTFCSAVCIWGTPFGCEAYGADAFCVLPVQDDLGACVELCEVPEDCAQPGYDCVPVGTIINGRSGACLPPTSDEAPPAEEPAP